MKVSNDSQTLISECRKSTLHKELSLLTSSKYYLRPENHIIKGILGAPYVKKIPKHSYNTLSIKYL